MAKDEEELALLISFPVDKLLALHCDDCRKQVITALMAEATADVIVELNRRAKTQYKDNVVSIKDAKRH